MPSVIFDRRRWWLPADDTLGFVKVEAGPFSMGSDKTRDVWAEGDEQPQHTIDLPAFYIGRFLVTVAQFKAYVEAAHPMLRDPSCLQGVLNHPVVNVTWHEAIGYCQWLTEQLWARADVPPSLERVLNETFGSGGEVRLPSEAEWEKAARGTDGRIYPWGDEFDPEKANAWETRIGGTSDVGAFQRGKSPCGAFDMSGNVWEWTRSIWGTAFQSPTCLYPYVSDDGREDSEAPDNTYRVVRGGSFLDLGHDSRAACRYRRTPGSMSNILGFRVVVSCSRS